MRASALVNGVVLSVPLTAVVWLALRLIPRRVVGASTRYVIWWAALIACLALPAILVRPRMAATPQPASPERLRITALSAGAEPATHRASFRSPLRIPAPERSRWFPTIWLLATSVLLLRLLLSHCAIRRVCARATDLAFPPEGWRAAAGLRGARVRIASSVEVPAPFATGPFDPAIVIPADLRERVSREDLNRIGLHEAVHLARFDDCAILAERLLVAFCPWHLSVHWIVRQIDTEREIACDDRAVELTGCPRDYAECLMRIAELSGSAGGSLAAAGMAVHGTRLARRVELLVSAARPRPGFSRIPAAPFAVGILALLLVLARAPLPVVFAIPLRVPAQDSMTLAPVPPPLADAGGSERGGDPKEKKMTSPTAKRLVRKLALAAATTAALAVPAASQPQPQPAANGRYIAILVDGAGLSPSDLRRASDAAVRIVQVQMRAGDQIAIMVSTERGVRVRQDFTTDHDVLTNAAQSLANLPDKFVADVPRSSERWTDVLGASLQILGRLSGKKLLVSMAAGSPGLSPSQSSTLIDGAIKANVAVYQIDVRGLPGQ